ncbi:MAG: hypothetical protein IPH36_14290 [Saprospiraceae bacterium]|nr:hypothetical protein [Saprospiraceae bacterium]
MKLFRHLGVFIRHKQSVAVGSAFLLLGIMFGSWATFIPYIKDKFQLDDGDLGLMLLFFLLGLPCSIRYQPLLLKNLA